MLGPVYEGVSITTEGTTRVSATFLETNGLHVIWVPFVHGLPGSHSDIDAPGGAWLIVRTRSASVLGSDDSSAADAHITIGEIDAWKPFTRSLATGDRESRAGVEGDRALGLPSLSTLSIIA